MNFIGARLVRPVLRDPKDYEWVWEPEPGFWWLEKFDTVECDEEGRPTDAR